MRELLLRPGAGGGAEAHRPAAVTTAAVPGEEIPPERLAVKLVLACGCNCVGLASTREACCFVHGAQPVAEMRLLPGTGRPRPGRSRRQAPV